MSDHISSSSDIRKGKVGGYSYPAARDGLRCRSCQEEMSTKEALKLHTCYSIMDRTITAEGNANRKRMVPGKLEIRRPSKSTRVKKTAVTKTRLFKKPNSIMLMKDKLLSVKIDPEAVALPKRQRLASEHEHGAGTLVVRCVRSVFLEHPVPLKWIQDRDTFQLQGVTRDCWVNIGRVDKKWSIPTTAADMNDVKDDNEEASLTVDSEFSLVLEESDDDSDFDVIIEKEVGLVNEEGVCDKSEAKNELAHIFESSENDSSIEITVDEEECLSSSVLSPHPVCNNSTESSCSKASAAGQVHALVKTSPVLPNKLTSTVTAGQTVCREDLSISEALSPLIETVVQVSKKEERNNSVSIEVKPLKSKQSWPNTNAQRTSLSVKFLVMKAVRKNNCLVLVKKLSSEEIKKWTARKSRDGDLWSAMSRASTARKKIKSSVSSTKSEEQKLNVVNHFQEYKEVIAQTQKNQEGEGSRSLVETVLEGDWDRGDLQTKKQIGFRIPKICSKNPQEVSSYDARAKDVVRTAGQVMSVRGFLATEKIEKDISVEQFMQEVGGEAEFGKMFDRIEVLKSSESNKTYKTEDVAELEELKHKDWDLVKSLTTDTERKKFAQNQFMNPVSSDPAVNLSFQGFRRNNAGSRVANFGSFTIMRGEMKPLPGYNIRGETEVKTEPIEVMKKIRLSDFAKVMKSLFYKKYARNLGVKKASQKDFDDFRSYLSHYKTGHEETLHFLSYYKQNVTLDCDQTDEVMDIENQYSTFASYYGKAETTFCSVCNTKHKFCQ
eukprot:GFUD01037125.1.p1 GENE.GFUD01037125.1~~GFUD01037125.1.p1  ORF type:complete len:900 (-),score=247.85 GFUD01037125.1:144-2474(-)